MDRIRRDSLLGLVFFGTLAFLLWATVNLTDMSLGKVPPLNVFFADGGGAQVGTNVSVLGMKVGKVGEIEFLRDRPDQRIRMLLLLQEDVRLAANATIAVRDSGVLGGKEIYIDPGTGEPWPADRPLIGTAREGAFERIGNIADAKGQIGESLDAALDEIRDFFRNMNDDQTTIGRLVRRRELYDEVLQTVQRLNGIFQSIQNGDGMIGRLVVDGTMRDNAMRLVTNLAEISETMRGTDGTVGMLLNDRDTAQRLRTIVADLATVVGDAREGKGPLGRILRDEQMAGDLANALADLRTLLQKANDPNAGVLGALTSDPETGENLKVAIANIRDVTDSLTAADGALGILINDKDVGMRVRRIFTQVTRALEDAREAAPIGNFVQVLFGAF